MVVRREREWGVMRLFVLRRESIKKSKDEKSNTERATEREAREREKIPFLREGRGVILSEEREKGEKIK